MVIECIGLPGSGKTYLMELVEKELVRREVDYVNVSANLMNRISCKIFRRMTRDGSGTGSLRSSEKKGSCAAASGFTKMRNIR